MTWAYTRSVIERSAWPSRAWGIDGDNTTRTILARFDCPE